MNILHSLLNLVVPPFTFISLFLLLPPYQALKSFLSLFGALFTENVAGKVVLITGASSGIGEHLAYEYAKRGACLVLVARRENLLEEVADIARYYGSPGVITIRVDVSKFDDCRRVINETMNHFGRLDHLVNNAAITHLVLFEDITDIAAFRRVMDINYWGAVFITHLAIPHLRYNRGKIVALSAPPAWLPAPRMSIYNSSKAAIKSMFETLRVELAPEIGVTIVTPGLVESELTKGKALNAQGKIELHQDMRDSSYLKEMKKWAGIDRVGTGGDGGGVRKGGGEGSMPGTEVRDVLRMVEHKIRSFLLSGCGGYECTQ